MFALRNLTLRKDIIALVNQIKRKLDAKCGPVVSCADLLTAAARDAVVVTGGTKWSNQYGRLDSVVSSAKAAQAWLPDARASVSSGVENGTSLLKSFTNLGLMALDLVVLSGAHTLGAGHCHNLGDRMPVDQGGYFNSQMQSKFDSDYQNMVQLTCRTSCQQYGKCDQGPDPLQTPSMGLDANRPSIAEFDNSYFKSVLTGSVLLTSDMALAYDPRTAPRVKQFAASQAAFFKAFATSMQKLGGIQPSSIKQSRGSPPVPVYPGNKYIVKKGTCA